MKLKKILPVVLFLILVSLVLINPKFAILFGIGAVITGSPLGDWKNKLNNIVLFNWKGINAARTYVIPTNPNTAGQQSQRTFFQSMIYFAQLIKANIIDTYWYPKAIKMSAFNAWVKENLLSMTGPTNFANMVMSKGSLTAEPITTAVKAGANLTISWDATLSGNQLADDLAYAVSINKTTLSVYFADAPVARSVESLVLTIPTGDTATDHNCFLFFYRDLNTVDFKISNSDHDVAST